MATDLGGTPSFARERSARGFRGRDTMEVSTVRRSRSQANIVAPSDPETRIDPSRRDPLRKYFSPIFLVVAASFLLPFITVSCESEEVGPSGEVTLTGMEAATGAGTSPVGAWGRDVDKQLPNPLALVALGCAVVGLAVALSKRAHRTAGTVAATGCVLGLAAFPLHMSITSGASGAEVRYGWYAATGGAMLALGLADLVAARSSFLEQGNENGLRGRTRLLGLTLGLIGVVLSLLATLFPPFTLFAAPAVLGFLAPLGCAYALIEERRWKQAPGATQRNLAPSWAASEAGPRNRAAGRSVGALVLGVVLCVLAAIFEAAWLVIVAVVVALASFVLGIVALRRVECGGRGRWPALLATSLAFVPIYALAVIGLTLLRV
jgi:hypothetical protein